MIGNIFVRLIEKEIVFFSPFSEECSGQTINLQLHYKVITRVCEVVCVCVCVSDFQIKIIFLSYRNKHSTIHKNGSLKLPLHILIYGFVATASQLQNSQ